jgi:D-3-phosphoglycerate dehydrogenase
MSDPIEALILDLLEWLGPRPRPYAEVIEAWRTSCPRLAVWEEADARGLLTREYQDGLGSVVSASMAGREYLASHRRGQPV